MLRKFIAIAVLAHISYASNAFAAPIAFQFDPGPTALSGGFSYDFDTGIYSDAQIVGSEATYCCDIYAPVYDPDEFTIRDDLPVGEQHQLYIRWDSSALLTPDGGTYLGVEFLGCGDVVCSSRYWDGTVSPVSAVPVPAAAWLFGSAMLGLMGVARRRKA